MTIRIEFPAHDRAAARVFAAALASLEAEREADLKRTPGLLGQDVGGVPLGAPEVASFLHMAAAMRSDMSATTIEDPATVGQEGPAPVAEPPVANLSLGALADLAGHDLPGTPAAPPPPADDLDVNGVRCDRAFCGPSKKADGTWARKRGVDEQAFAKWYASQIPAKELEALGFGAAHVADAPAIFTGTPYVIPPPPPAAPAAPDPTSGVGPFMTWVSERQAAGRLTQEQVKAAFTEEGVVQSMLFNAALDTRDMLSRLVRNLNGKLVVA